MSHTRNQKEPFEPQNEREKRLVHLLRNEYTFVKRLGRGAFATVYEVINKSLDRVEALKFLSSELTGDQAFLARFKVEAKICAGFTHPNIVTIYNSGAIEDLHYFTMTFVDGPTLSKYLKPENALPVQQVCAIMATVADAIDYSHRKGVIHRDLKTSNIMLDKAGKPYVTDFGIAKSEKSLNKTQTGLFIGSPHYVSPEQAESMAVDHRADIYSLGVCLYALLTQNYPFEGNTAISIIAKRLTHEPIKPQIHNPDLDPELIRIVTKTIQRYPDQRYASAAQLAEELRRACGKCMDEPTPSNLFGDTSKSPGPDLKNASKGQWIRRRALPAVLVLVLIATAIWLFRPWSIMHKPDPRVTALLDGAEQVLSTKDPVYADLLMAQNKVDQALAIEPENPRAMEIKTLFAQKIQAADQQRIEVIKSRLTETAAACRANLENGRTQACIQRASETLAQIAAFPDIQPLIADQKKEIEQLCTQAETMEKERRDQLAARQKQLEQELDSMVRKAKAQCKEGNLRGCAKSADALLARLAQMPVDQAAAYAALKSEMVGLKSEIARQQARKTFTEQLHKRVAQVESDYTKRNYDQCIEGAIAVKSRIESLPLNSQAQYSREKERVINLQYKAEQAKQHRESQYATLERVRRKIEEGALGSALSLINNMLTQPGIDEDIEQSLQSEKKRIQTLWNNKPSNIDSGNITIKKVE